MKGLVWALYILVQDPSAGDLADSRSWAFTGVTYLNRSSCAADAKTFTAMDVADKAEAAGGDAIISGDMFAYVCVLQPNPGHYKG